MTYKFKIEIVVPYEQGQFGFQGFVRNVPLKEPNYLGIVDDIKDLLEQRLLVKVTTVSSYHWKLGAEVASTTVSFDLVIEINHFSDDAAELLGAGLKSISSKYKNAVIEINPK